MVVLKKDIPYEPNDLWRIVFFGDIHYGSSQCDEVLLDRFVEMYADKPNTILCDLGDEVDGIIHGDKRYDPLAVAKRYRDSRNMMDLVFEDLKDTLMPLKGKILCGTDSNHNFSYRRETESDPHWRLSQALGFTRLGVAGDLLISWKARKRGIEDKITGIHLAHSACSRGASTGAITNTLRRKATIFSADVLAQGDTHHLSIPEPVRSLYTTPAGDRKVRVQHVCLTGSFVKAYSETEWSPYTEERAVEPAALGWVVCEIWLPSYDEKPHIRLFTEEWTGFGSAEASLRGNGGSKK